MTCKGEGVCGLLFGVFLIVFTFISWAPAKWIIFAGGILIVLKSLHYGKCCSKGSCSTDAGSTDVASKKHKTGEELFLTKKKRSNFPSKDEVKEVITKAKKKTVAKKKTTSKKK